jgi:transcriptional regulator with XRE-family HTH domain
VAQRPVDIIVGARLAALRTARGVSQAQLGSVLGTTATEIADYESGAVRIPAARLIEICQFFQVRLRALFPSMDPDHDPNLH